MLLAEHEVRRDETAVAPPHHADAILVDMRERLQEIDG
jgi:hypothetical protein